MKGETYQSSHWVILEAARLCYMEQLSQKEIALRLGVSNVTVSRLLHRAKEMGVVQVSFAASYANLLDMSRELKSIYFLNQVIITDPSFAYEHELTSKQAVALEGARYIQRTISNDDVLGIAWGKTMYYLVQFLNPCRKTASSFVTLHGSISESHPEFDPQALVRRISMAMGGDAHCLLAPGLFSSAQALGERLRNLDVQKIMDSFSCITTSVSGVGSFYQRITSPLLELNYLSEAEIAGLRNAGCYGDFLLRFIDKNGQECCTDLKERTLSIQLNTYLQIPRRLVVASGAYKAHSLRAVLRGGLATVLVIDRPLAEELLAIS